MTDICRRKFIMIIIGGNLFPINMACNAIPHRACRPLGIEMPPTDITPNHSLSEKTYD